MLCAELDGNVNFDEELQKILLDYGSRGWELVQVLRPKNDARYHLVFKMERPHWSLGRALVP